VFRDYGESGTGTTRHYVHDDDEAKLYGAEPGTFTEWVRCRRVPISCFMKACMARS